MRLKIILLLLIVALISVAAVAAGEPSEGKKTTVMIYMCGADLEAKSFAGTRTFKTIYDTKPNLEQVNVVALLGGTTVWGRGYDPSKLTLVEAGGKRNAVEVDSFDGRDMGDPETLTAFLDVCRERYPAEHYILIMWDHGGGPNGGVCFDLLYGDDSLSVGELASALENSVFADKGLDIIAFHTCLTGTIEYAANLAPYARYMVATEDSMYGLDYGWLTTLDTDESLDTVHHMVDGTYALNRDAIKAQNALEMNSVAAVDLDKVEPVVRAMDVFFTNVIPNVDINGFVHTSQCRRDSLTFGSTESNGAMNYDMADLGDLTVHLAEYDPEGADQLLTALSDAVIYMRSDEENSTGLTVYHPYSNKVALKDNMAAHNDIKLSDPYSAYIQQFAAMMTGTPLADWTDLHTERTEKKDLRTLFSLQLSEEQGENLASSRFRILRKLEDGSWTQIFDTPETYIFERNITGQYNGIALYAVANDQAVSPTICYDTGAGNTILIRAKFIRSGDGELPDFESDGLLCCAVEDDQLIPGGVMIYDEATDSYTSAYGMAFLDFSEISIPCISRLETRDEKGTLLPFDQWDIAAETTWSSPIDGSWSFRFLHDTIATEELYGAFEVADVQQYRYTSDLARVAPETPDNQFDPTHVMIQVQYDDMGMVVINQFNLTSGEAGLTMNIHVTNLLPEQEALIQMQELTVNESAVAVSNATAYGNGDNWGLLPQETQILTANIPATDIPPMEEITDIAFNLTLINAADESETLGSVPITVSIIRSAAP